MYHTFIYKIDNVPSGVFYKVCLVFPKQGHLPNAAAHTSSDSVKHTLLHYVFLSHERNSLVLVASEAHFNADFEVIMGNIIKWTIHKVTHFHCALHETILQ